MAETLLLDRYLAEFAPEVLERAQWAADTHDFYGLRPETAVIIGSRALDMCGIDGGVRFGSGGTQAPQIDLDVVVPPFEVTRLKLDFPQMYADDDIDIFDPPRSLHNHFIEGERPMDVIARMYRADLHKVDFDIASADASPLTVPGRTGTYTVQAPEVAVEWKLSSGASRHVLGVLYAHASAHRQGLEVARGELWQSVIKGAVETSQELHPAHIPDWLQELQAKPLGIYSHPAFASFSR